MIALEQISLRIGTRTLLDRVEWNLGSRERVALVGRNGAGKTTLIRIALGQGAPDEGSVRRARDVRTGYLPQEELPLDGATPLEVSSAAVDGSDHPSTAARAQAEAAQVLDGLGFSQSQMRAPLPTLSGGWRMRVHLARLLLSRPTHLFLDEPTNHLDLPSLAWLEEFLREFAGTLVVISHDRAFLDRMVTKVVELEKGRLTTYAGNYSRYAEEKERRRAALLAAKLNQDKRIQQLERFIERFRAKNTKATQAKSKEKLLAKIRRIEIEDDPDSIHFRFEPAPRCGQVVVTLQGASKRFGGDPPLFERLDFEVERGERIAIVGPNGAGKSTLLRILAGSEPLDGGARCVDDRAVVSFFAQHTAESLDLAATVFAEVRRAAPRTTLDLRLRTLLGAFLFSGDEIDKKVGVLSGGEKARVAIAKTLVQPTNVLLLDEPTNHLDLAGKEMLAEALRGYDGTLVLVTHDRHLIDRVASRVVEVSPGADGTASRVKSYLGGFTQYAEMRRREGRPLPGYAADGKSAEPPARLERTSAALSAASDATEAVKPGDAHRERRREERAKAGQESKLLARLEELEVEKAALERAFEDPALYADAARWKEKHERHAAIAAEIAAAWAKLEGR